MERIQKVLARSNVASRRAVEQMIEEGRVRLNNKTVTELGKVVDVRRDTVHVDGRLVTLMPEDEIEPICVLLNKPPNVVTTLKDDLGRRTIMELLPEYRKSRLFPIGRLDYDAQGALLLTNDGELAQELMHPKFKRKKVYLVKVKGTPKADDLDLLRRGVYLDDGPTGPSEITHHRDTKNNTWLQVTLTSGKYRQLKRMFFRINNPVQKILRIEFAGIPLGKLPVGGHRLLNQSEIKMLKNPPALKRV